MTMYRKLPIWLFLHFIVLPLSSLLCSCGDLSSLTGADSNSSTVDATVDLLGSAASDSFNTLWISMCLLLKEWASCIILGSVLFGVLLVELFKKNMEIRKYSITVFCIGIPLFIFVLTYVLCFLYGVMFQVSDVPAATIHGRFPYIWYRKTIEWRVGSLILMLLSLICGLVTRELAKENVVLRRVSITVLCIKVPGIIFLTVPAYRYLYMIFS